MRVCQYNFAALNDNENKHRNWFMSGDESINTEFWAEYR
jgi:hypothetical protein